MHRPIISVKYWKRAAVVPLFAVLAAWASFASTGAGAAIGPWNPGPFAAGDNTYDGYIDLPTDGTTVFSGSALRVGGWAIDRTAQGWAGIDDVHVYLGKAGEGGTFIGRALFGSCPTSGDLVAQLCRPDVALVLNNAFFITSGFTFTIPGGTLPPGLQTLSVYIHTPSKGWWYKQATVVVVAATPTPAIKFTTDPLVYVIAPPEEDAIDVGEDEYIITGYALDRNSTSGSGVDRVQVYIDNPRGSGTYLGDAQLQVDHGSGSQYGNQFNLSGYERSFKPTDYSDGSHTLYVYARSSITGKETLVTRAFRIS